MEWRMIAMRDVKNMKYGWAISSIVALALLGLLCPFLLTTGCSNLDGGEEHEHGKAMCSSDVTCDGDRVRYEGVEIPRIGFLVEGQLTCCMESAKRLSKGDPSKIKYVVAGKKCKNLEEAKVARLKVLEEFYSDLFTIKKIEGKPTVYRLAGYGFANEDGAKKAAASARTVAEKATVSNAGDKPAATDETAIKTRLIEAKITAALDVVMKAAKG